MPATELFHDLYQRAFRLDCPRLHVLNSLTSSLGPDRTTSRVRLADGLLLAGREFDEGLEDVIRRNRMPVRDFELRCPSCGSPHCPGAVPTKPLPKSVQEHLMNGGSLSDFLTSGT